MRPFGECLMSGESADNPIVIMAEDEITGVQMEYMHIEAERCDCGGKWEVLEQALIEHDGKPYDQIRVRCERCGLERDFFFDISAFYGRL